jgi:peptide/nickel transport system substrate-binding protein
MSTHRRSAVIVTIVLALVGAGCTRSNGGGGGGGSVEGGTLRIGTSSGLISPNPFVGFNQDDYSVWMYIYPSLLQYDTTSPGYDWIGNFATDWTISPDGLTVTYTTVPNAKWSDGEPLTADDVVFTIDMIEKYAKGPTASWAGAAKFLKSLKATDPNTLVATYERPSGTALYDLGLTPILPPQVWGQLATGDGKDIKTFPNVPENGKPLTGGGPFVMTKYVKDSVALFERNPNWYGPEPHIDGFGLQFFRDEDAMITALRTDQLDAINEIPPTSVKPLQSAGLHVYVGDQGLSLRDLIINVDPNKTEHRELLDPQVREAFEYAIDRNQIVQTAWLGFATPGSTIVPAGDSTGGVQWQDPGIQPLPYDPAKANQILDDLGYARGSGGIRVANGHPMSYDVIFPQDEQGAGDRAFQIIQQGFTQIGVQLTQKNLDDNATWHAMWCGTKCGYNFDLAMWDWFPSADPDFILSVLTCDEYGTLNDSGYCNPQYDKLYEEQKSTVDPQQRAKIVYQMQQLAFNDRPYIILTYDKRLDAWSNHWEGFVPSTQGIFNSFSTQSLIGVHRVS